MQKLYCDLLISANDTVLLTETEICKTLFSVLTRDISCSLRCLVNKCYTSKPTCVCWLWNLTLAGGESFLFLVNQGSAIFTGIIVSVTYLNIEQEVYCHRECSLQDNHTPHLRTLCSKVERFLRKRFRLLNRFCERLVRLNVTLNLQKQKIYLF